METVVLAGGLGTRLRSAVPNLPKPMAPVLGRPFLAYLLDYAAEHGVSRVILSIGHLGEIIANYFGAEWHGMELVYVREPAPLGTGGALARCFQCVNGRAALALNGDTFFAIDYRAMEQLHTAAGASVTIALRTVPDCSRYGGAVVRDGRICEYRAAGKATRGLISGGVYLINAEIFRRYSFPEKFSIEQDLFEPKAAEIRPAAFVSDAPFLDIGVPESYYQAQEFLRALRRVPEQRV